MSSEAYDTGFEGDGGQDEGGDDDLEVEISARLVKSADETDPTGATPLPKSLQAAAIKGLGPWVLHRFSEFQAGSTSSSQTIDKLARHYTNIGGRPRIIQLGNQATAQLIKQKWDASAEPLRTWVEVFGIAKEPKPTDPPPELPAFEQTPAGLDQELSQAAQFLKNLSTRQLSEGEARTLESMVLGEFSKEVIARRLETTGATVKGHMSGIYRKLGISDEVEKLGKAEEAVRLATEHLIKAFSEPSGPEPLTETEVESLRKYAGDRLTDRQFTILLGLAEGDSNEDLAARTHVTIHGMQHDKRRVYDLLGIHGVPRHMMRIKGSEAARRIISENSRRI